MHQARILVTPIGTMIAASSGSIGGYSGGVRRKKFLLALEKEEKG